MFTRYLSHRFGKATFSGLMEQLINCESIIVEYYEILCNAGIESKTLDHQQRSALKQFLVAIGCTQLDENDDHSYWGISGNSNKDIATFNTLIGLLTDNTKQEEAHGTDVEAKF